MSQRLALLTVGTGEGQVSMPNCEAVVHVIDDDAAVRDALAFVLASEDLKVHTYASAEAFLTALPPEVDGCIVTDVRMPGISGIELLRRLRKMGLMLPVIVVTGHADAHIAAEAINSGALACVMKPFNDDGLLSTIRSVLGRPAIQGLSLGRA
jgi:two-component system, LuxR family, response regulator FixJ